MKTRIDWKTYIVTPLLLSLPLTGCGSAEAKIPEPVLPPDALVTVSIPDVHRTIDAFQEITDRILPEEARVQLKTEIGKAIEDPGLKGIPSGAGAALVWDGTHGFAFLECTPETAQKLVELAKAPQVSTAAEGDFFLLSNTPTGLEQGIRNAKAVSETLLQKNMAGVVLQSRLADLTQRFMPQINMMTMMMPNMMAAQTSPGMPENQANTLRGMATFVEGELRVLTSLASQIESMEVVLLPSKESLTTTTTFSVKEDTNLHALVTAPTVAEPDPLVSTDLLQPGAIEFEMRMGNPNTVWTFLQAEADHLFAEMTLEPDTVANAKEMMKLWRPFLSSSMAETMCMNPETGFSMDFIASIQDKDAYLNLIKSMPETMKPFTDFYEELGMPIRFEVTMNARTYRDADIHRYGFRYELDQMDPVIAEQMKRVGMSKMDSELTVLDNRVLWTMGDASLENLIDRVRKGASGENKLHARKVHPAGGFGYYDIEVGEYMAFIASTIPEGAGEAIFNKMIEELKNTPPMTGAAFQHEHRVQFIQTLPVEILKASATAGYKNAISSTSQPSAKPVSPR